MTETRVDDREIVVFEIRSCGTQKSKKGRATAQSLFSDGDRMVIAKPIAKMKKRAVIVVITAITCQETWKPGIGLSIKIIDPITKAIIPPIVSNPKL